MAISCFRPRNLRGSVLGTKLPSILVSVEKLFAEFKTTRCCMKKILDFVIIHHPKIDCAYADRTYLYKLTGADDALFTLRDVIGANSKVRDGRNLVTDDAGTETQSQ